MANNARVLNFRSDNLPKTVTLLLAFTPPPISGVAYQDVFPVCWSMLLGGFFVLPLTNYRSKGILSFKKGATTDIRVVYSGNTAFFASKAIITFPIY